MCVCVCVCVFVCPPKNKTHILTETNHNSDNSSYNNKTMQTFFIPLTMVKWKKDNVKW
jgi:uncharacterized membrane protein